jgi:hypothetical protein
VVIPSKGRSTTIRQHTLALFPQATVCIDEAEEAAYRRVLPEDQLLLHPNGVHSLSMIRNFIFDHVEAEVLLHAADDITGARCEVGWRPRMIRDPQTIAELIETTAQCCRDAGAFVFGFNQDYMTTHLAPMQPFKLNTWVGTVMGTLAGHGLRYDEEMPFHTDVDFCLQSLLKHRIVWCDTRFVFIARKATNVGGMASVRTAEAYRDAHRRLRAKWGQYVRIAAPPRHGKRRLRTLSTSVRVARQQELAERGLA